MERAEAETELLRPLLSCWESWGWDPTSHSPVLALELTAPSSSLRPLLGRSVVSCLPVDFSRRRRDAGESVYRQLPAAGRAGMLLQAGMWHPGHCPTFTRGCGEAPRDPLSARGVTGQKLPMELCCWENKMWEL